MDSLHQWIEAHRFWAPWLQAIGSLFAIAVAIWVPTRLHNTKRKDDQEERRLKTRGFAVGIFPELVELKKHIEAVREMDEGLPLASTAGLTKYTERMTLGMPPYLNSRLDDLYLFREPLGPRLQQLVAMVAQYNRQVTRTLGVVKSGHIEGLDTTFKGIQGYRDKIGELLDQIMPLMPAVHDPLRK